MHNDETPAELLQQLLDACDEGNQEATELAQRTEIADLRSFLYESARQYRRAAEDICMAGRIDRTFPVRRARGHYVDDATTDDFDVASTWERAECVVLTYFRDAYDGSLPRPVAETVKRHFEAGVNRLERFRKLQSGRD